MHLSDFDISNQYRALVKESVRLTPHDTDEVRELRLEIADAGFTFRLGQSLGVIVPGPHAFGHREHFRLYTIGSSPTASPGQIEICVKRITYIDPYSGEAYPGIASNYLCDRKPGDHITVTGPYPLPFEIPADPTANLVMIGMGTGIAPFRAMVRLIYDHMGGWQGQVRLFYGARTGLESLYMNDKRDDFANYYDEQTFQAFRALSPRPHRDDPAALDSVLEQHAQDTWSLLSKPNTHVFVAGQDKIQELLDRTLARLAGSKTNWETTKQLMQNEGRWNELIY